MNTALNKKVIKAVLISEGTGKGSLLGMLTMIEKQYTVDSDYKANYRLLFLHEFYKRFISR